MVAKVGIVTIQSYNFGNRLQNYALQSILMELGCEVYTISKKHKESLIKSKIKVNIKKLINLSHKKYKYIRFDEFNWLINWDYITNSNVNNLVKKYNYFIAGSDQIWNPYFDFVGDHEFLQFARLDQRIAYSASIGLNELPQELIIKYTEYFKSIPYISVREDAAAKIIKQCTGRDVPVTIDPTMLLDARHWAAVGLKSQINIKGKYILKYFLGKNADDYNVLVEKIAKENNAKIINAQAIFQGKGTMYGPCEFINLIQHAHIVCTDSFHGSVFSIIFHVPVFIFKRPFEKGYGEMSSRIDTLLSKFQLENRCISNVDDLNNISYTYDFSNCDTILTNERNAAILYLKEALRMKKD